MSDQDKPIDLSQIILELLKHNQKAQAIELCRKRLSVDSNDLAAKYYLGIMLIMNEEWANGLDYLLSLPVAYDNNIKYLEAIVVAALQLKRNDLILKYGEAYLKNQKILQANIALACGNIFMNDKQDNLAYQFFKIASLDPKTAEASHLKIMEIGRHYQPESGLEHALLYLKLKADDLQARLGVAFYHFDLHKLSEVEAILSPIYEMVMRGEDIVGVDMVGLTYLYLNLYNYEKARTICEYALKRTDENNPYFNEFNYYFSSIECYFENYALGWKKAEYRLKSDNPFRLEPKFKQLVQYVKPINNLDFPKFYRLILIAEQMLGDNIQLLRYLPLLMAKIKQRNASLDILIPPNLKGVLPLYTKIFKGNIITESNIDDVIANAPSYDGFVGNMSLHHLFSKEYPTPIPPLPFTVKPEKIALWQTKLKTKTKKIRIGFSFSTSPHNLTRRFPIELMQSWLKLDLEFILIQDEIPASTEAYIKDKENIVYFKNEIKDFEDSAAILHHCDLFIGVDSSMIHLAGSQGIRTIMLHPTPSMWAFPDRKLKDPNAIDSLWYPTMEIIRQPSRGDWESVSPIILHKLEALINYES